MKYLPTIDLWADGVQSAILSGALKLQRGQWVRCGNSRPSRFVRCNGKSIWAVHWSPSQRQQFERLCDRL